MAGHMIEKVPWHRSSDWPVLRVLIQLTGARRLSPIQLLPQLLAMRLAPQVAC